MWPVAWTARGDGASLFKDRCVRVMLYKSTIEHPYYRVARSPLSLAPVVWPVGMDLSNSDEEWRCDLSLRA
jgi:hypothetical protein